MGDKSGIEWTEATWNPIAGCDLVSPGCLNCYAMRMAARIARMQPENVKYQGVTKVVNGNAVWTGKVNLGDEVLFQPLDWKKPRYIFVNSMSDLFHQDVSLETIARVFAVMGLASWHTYQVLTKRSARMAEVLNSPAFAEAVEEAACEFDGYADERAQQYGYVNVLARMKGDWRSQDHTALPMPNVWIGISAENQETYDKRSLDLLRIDAAVRWISFEPLLGPIQADMVGAFDWAVVGGESGEGARPMEIAWAADLVLQCGAQDVPFFMKQLGGVRDKRGELEGFPPALRVRQYPREARV